MSASGRYQWVMLALLWLVYASFGLVSGSMGVLVTPIVNDLGLNHSEMGMVLGSWQLVFIIASIAAGNIIDRATSHGIMSWLPRILENAGMTPAEAGYAASANMLAGLPVVLILPRVTPRRLRALVLGVGALAAALALWGVIATTGALLWVSLIAVGVAGSAYLPLLVLMLMDSPEVPAEYLGSANGVFMSVAQIGGFVAPLMVGALHDLTGGFLAGVLVIAGLNVLAIPVTVRLNAGTTKAVVRQPAA